MKIPAILLVLVFFCGCTSVREYHVSAESLRAVVADQGLPQGVPSQEYWAVMRPAIEQWAAKRDAAWAIPNKIIMALKAAKTVAEKLKVLKGP